MKVGALLSLMSVMETEPYRAPRTLTLARVGAGMTMGQLAASSGVSPKTISRLEAGLHAPRLSTAMRICHALGYGAAPALLFPEHFQTLPAGPSGEALTPAAPLGVPAAGVPSATEGDR